MTIAHTPLRAIIGIAGLAMVLTVGFVTDAKAVPTTYAVSGTLTFSPTNIDTISGDFTYNPVGNLATIDVTLVSTGSITSGEAGRWNGAAIYTSTGGYVLFSNAGPANLYIVLGSDLTSLPVTETITGVSWICGFRCRADTTSVTSNVTSAPEPGSLALLGTGLSVIPLTGRSRFRRGTARLQRMFA